MSPFLCRTSHPLFIQLRAKCQQIKGVRPSQSQSMADRNRSRNATQDTGRIFAAAKAPHVYTSLSEEIQTPFRFFDLPPELQNCVYAHILDILYTSGIYRRDKSSEFLNTKGPRPISRPAKNTASNRLNILQTCRLVYTEAHIVLYGK